MHLLDNSIPKALKKACYGGSDKKIGCSWTQFSGDIDAAIDHVALSIDDEYVSYQHEKTAKITYFMFYNDESAEKCMNTPTYYNCMAVELYQTVTLEEGTQIITILNTKNVNIREVVEAVNSTFTKNGIIYDFSTYSVRVDLKKNIDRFTEFSSIKQPEKINSELSDQSIYVDNSCWLTPNFKKEWANDHENYSKNNFSVAVINMNLVNELADNHDFEKNYDRVVHDQLLHKLKYSRIGRKLLQVIKGLYHAPRLSVKVNDAAFDAMAGVSVPGLDDKISGLLFSDDAVILAESADELQKSFNILTE
ncbi:hypothetical protein BB561_003648 [Smittium simulii]|uniref:Reverse transcriptase domain-containing protein n=1 Tax=Smittium simulii TaxID=133385 RepID=A0A2T9YK48_9FUNG|nr:hypothetical protein BB561_003648 [Smittium simulii]